MLLVMAAVRVELWGNILRPARKQMKTARTRPQLILPIHEPPLKSRDLLDHELAGFNGRLRFSEE